MAEKEIKITLDEKKLEALNFFLGEKNENVESVLRAQLDKTYDKYVPEPVKKFIENRRGGQDENTTQEPERPQRQARESGRRTNRQSTRQTATEPVETQASESETAQTTSEEQAEEPVMSMGM